MAYDFSELAKGLSEAKEWLQKEYTGLRTGRATPALLDVVQVEAYGAKMAMNQVATVATEDARALRVTPYDLANSKSIEKAIVQANLGVSTSVDDRGLRVSFPELTGERRASLVKVAKERLEEARIRVRGVRDSTWSDIQEKQRDGEISEDEKFRLKEEMEKLVGATNKELEALFEKKESEILH